MRVLHKNRWMHIVSGGLAVGLAIGLAAPQTLRAQHGNEQDRNRSGLHDQESDHDFDERDETATPIRHLVVIFQENVSFDHYFATYPGARNDLHDGPAFAAKSGTPLVNGLLPGGLLDHNPNTLAGTPAQPFRLTPAQAVTCDQGHGYMQEQQAFNMGLMNRFPDTVGNGSCGGLDYGHGKGLVMGYYDGNTVSAMWNYAQTFAMNDNSYSTTFGPSTPGAVNLIAGQTHGAMVTAGSAAGNVTAIDPMTNIGSVIGDPRPDPALDNCTLAGPRTYIRIVGPNIGDLLNRHRVTWGWFQGGFRPAPAPAGAPANPPGSTPGPPGNVICGSAHQGLPGTGTSFDYIPHHEPFQ